MNAKACCAAYDGLSSSVFYFSCKARFFAGLFFAVFFSFFFEKKAALKQMQPA